MRRLSLILCLGLPALILEACGSDGSSPAHDSTTGQVLAPGVDVPSLNDRSGRNPLGGPSDGEDPGQPSGGTSSGAGGSSGFGGMGGLGGMNMGGLGGKRW